MHGLLLQASLSPGLRGHRKQHQVLFSDRNHGEPVRERGIFGDSFLLVGGAALCRTMMSVAPSIPAGKRTHVTLYVDITTCRVDTYDRYNSIAEMPSTFSRLERHSEKRIHDSTLLTVF